MIDPEKLTAVATAEPVYGALTFQFVRGADLTSDLLAWFGAGDFSHVDIVLDKGLLLGARSDSIGGKPPGVQIRPPGYDPKWTKQVIISIPCTLEQQHTAETFALGQVGKAYDKLAIVGFAVGRDWRDDTEWFCSELGARYGEIGGVWSELYTPANKVEPSALAMLASGISGRTITVVK